MPKKPVCVATSLKNDSAEPVLLRWSALSLDNLGCRALSDYPMREKVITGLREADRVFVPREIQNFDRLLTSLRGDGFPVDSVSTGSSVKTL